MKKILMLTICAIVYINTFAQTNSLKGDWKLQDVSLEKLDNDNSAGLSVENFIFRDVYKNQTPITIEKNTITFSKDNQPYECTFEITEDGEFKLIFRGFDNRVSYTVYQYTLNGNELILFREDPLLREQYSFVR